MARQNPPIIIDHGTYSTKLGFSTSSETIIPKSSIDGMVSDDEFENLFHESYYHHLRADPTDHFVLLSEDPSNTAEDREKTAEILFESFGIPGLSITSSSMLALAGNCESKEKMTGLVVDCGYSKTSLVPIVDGLIISEGIEQINRGGRDIDQYIQSMMRARKEGIPPSMSLEVARFVKEHYTYTCPCPIKESERFRCNSELYQKTYKGIDKHSGNEFQYNVGIEQFLAPEILMNPKIHNQELNISLANAVDNCIMKCPIDTKRQLYGNIILCGGSSVFKDFHRRLQKDVKHLIESRLVASRARAGISDTTSSISDIMKVNVIENTTGVASMFLGGCTMTSHPRFFDTCITKQLYEEEGARLFSTNIYR